MVIFNHGYALYPKAFKNNTDDSIFKKRPEKANLGGPGWLS